jgi:glutamate/tyrosine decarboxylase-like PLP-dependent enzyme
MHTIGSTRPWLKRAADLAERYLDSLPSRPVAARASFGALMEALGGRLPDEGSDPTAVVERLAAAVEPGLVATAGPRYFGFVIGGSLPATVAADWLTSAWDQNAGLTVASPAAAAVEAVVAGWVLELLGLPPNATVGLVTGCQMANFTGLAAGRHAVLARAGWDVEQNGLTGAPAVEVVVGDEAHATIFSSLRMLGLGAGRVRRVAADGQGRMRPEVLERVLADCMGPTIVCAQAGNVNTGGFDPLEEIAAVAHERGAWLHVDGAFGLWAAAAPGRRHLIAGLERADSWATDAHKWLNVPYDSGLVAVADGAAHRRAMAKHAAYLITAAAEERDNYDFTPESSRRARGFTLWAALTSLGRRGVADLVERCCRLAERMAARLSSSRYAKVLNDVVLNQVLVRFELPDGGDGDAFTRAVIAGVQREGTCWAGGTRWHGREAMRISVSGWSTTEEDIDRSADAIVAVAEHAASGR